MARVPVFIVEDSASMQSALKDLLEAVGRFEVAGSAVGESEATEWLQQHAQEWQVAVVDLLLRDGSGFALVRRCRTGHRDGHVIVFSEFATPALKAKCLALGADAVFLKSELPQFVRHLEALAPAPEAPAARLSPWSVVRHRDGSRYMGVRSVSAWGTAVCAWFDTDGSVRTEEHPVADLDCVPALGSDDNAWLDAFRAAHEAPLR